MSSLDRYFADRPIKGNRATIDGDEARHLARVMRGKPGTQVVLFDGSGCEYLARIEQVGRTHVELAVLARQEVDRECPVDVVLAVSLPRGDRRRWLVEKAVELGVRRLVPLQTARSVARPVQQALKRLERTVIEASKQCGRNRLMEIGRPQRWSDFVSATCGAPTRLLAHPGTERAQSGRIAPAQPPFQQPITGPVLLAIGPEGGLTDNEVALATAAGWQLVDLGPRILRVETAAIFLVAMVMERLLR